MIKWEKEMTDKNIEIHWNHEGKYFYVCRLCKTYLHVTTEPWVQSCKHFKWVKININEFFKYDEWRKKAVTYFFKKNKVYLLSRKS